MEFTCQWKGSGSIYGHTQIQIKMVQIFFKWSSWMLKGEKHSREHYLGCWGGAGKDNLECSPRTYITFTTPRLHINTQKWYQFPTIPKWNVAFKVPSSTENIQGKHLIRLKLNTSLMNGTDIYTYFFPLREQTFQMIQKLGQNQQHPGGQCMLVALSPSCLPGDLLSGKQLQEFKKRFSVYRLWKGTFLLTESNCFQQAYS